ncbi:hypothetical protein ACFCW6_06465 [Streptomyces sp. NPDC056333]|uniref:hypothetical protein n=1 Tax=Streptomyces sp. NPDC056333 TaxID=3345786 RepID=UPI0035D6928C
MDQLFLAMELIGWVHTLSNQVAKKLPQKALTQGVIYPMSNTSPNGTGALCVAGSEAVARTVTTLKTPSDVWSVPGHLLRDLCRPMIKSPS